MFMILLTAIHLSISPDGIVIKQEPQSPISSSSVPSSPEHEVCIMNLFFLLFILGIAVQILKGFWL